MAISESLHWYAQDGSPAYTVPYADPSKGDRPTTLRDAKKNGFVPSVTQILSIPAKPALENWKRDQVLQAAYQYPSETDYETWKSFILQKSQEISKTTAEKGTAIHAAIERFYKGQSYLAEYKPHVNNVVSLLKSYSNDWTAEKSFGHPLGYGGKVDLFTPGFVIDFKSKDFKPSDTGEKLAFPEMAMQLDAYRHGLNMPDAVMISVFIDRETGKTLHHEWKEDNYFDRFCCLLKYWQLNKNYNSAFEKLVATL